jgi:SAM-dependent methyltransferase
VLSSPIPDYWPLLLAYHRLREELYRTIIAATGLTPDARILDAGCGDGFYSRLLAECLGVEASIVAVDNNPALLYAAGDLPAPVHRCLSDMDHLALEPGSFDAVWLCRTMHSAPDPLARLRALAPLLRPGGQLIVIENDSAHDPILSLPADLEGRLREARDQYEKSRCTGGQLRARYQAARHLPAWLIEVGLQAITAHTYVSQEVAPMDEAAETYWRLQMAWQGHHLEPFLSSADREVYWQAFDPASPDYALSQPGFNCLELTTVVCGIRPDQ